MRFRLPTGRFGRLLLVAASSLVAVLLVEAGLRAFLPQNIVRLPPSIWARDGEFGLRYAGGLDLEINTGEGTVRFQTDERGYRVGAASGAAGGGAGATGSGGSEQVVLLVGDSFLAGLQVEHDETFAARLEEDVSRELGTPVSVVNSGTGGWDPYQYRIVAERELEGASYAGVVVFLYTGNDIVSERESPEEYAARFSAEPPPPPSWRRRLYGTLYTANVYLTRRSHAFIFLKERTQFLRVRLGLSSYYFPWALLREHAESPNWEVTAGICREIADTAAAHDTPVLFVLLPGIYQVDREMSEPFRRAFGIAPEVVDIDQPSRRLGEAFEGVGLELVDLTPEMRRVWEAEGIEMYGRVDTHFSVEGHRVAAELLEERVLEMLGGRE